MVQPILVVDFGASSTCAGLVVGDRAALVKDPMTGAPTWPSLLSLEAGVYLAGNAAERTRRATPRFVVEGLRRFLDTETTIRLSDVELSPITALAAYLGSLRNEALRMYADRVERLVLTVPTAYGVPDRRRDQFIAAAEAAGFRDVELVGDAQAAILDAQSSHPFADGSLVLVCDLGDAWKTALMHIRGQDIVTLAQESSTAGRDLDTMLVDDLTSQTGNWLSGLVNAPGEAGQRARDEVHEYLRQLKHRATMTFEVSGAMREGAPVYRLTQDWLGRLAEPGLRWAVASCRSLLARASTALSGVVRAGSTVADVSAVVLVGGGARLPNAASIIHSGLDRPVLLPPDPEQALVRGGIRWAAGAAQRRVMADHPRWRVEPLSWNVPGGRGRLIRWSIGEGETYQRGSVLAQVRTPDERVFDLAAPDEGTLLAYRARVGEIVGPSVVAATKRPASCLAGDPPGMRQQLSATGEWLLLSDRQMLVECEANARLVRVWSIADGVPVTEFVPRLDEDLAYHGRVFVNPIGRLSLLAWDDLGAFSVWDVLAGTRTATFRENGAPQTVRVNEREWRLTVEGEDSTSAGRYRRSIATIWDLNTGRRLDRLNDDWQRRLPGYRERSAVDGFGEWAFSPDGRLRAVSVRTPAGNAAIALQESVNENEVFRAEQPSARARTAFSSDGRFLLANWESEHRSSVDVWEL